MKAAASNTPLSPEEFQKQLTDFVRQHFQNAPKNTDTGSTPSEEGTAVDSEPVENKTDEFEFNWRQPFPYREFEEFKEKYHTDKRELDD